MPDATEPDAAPQPCSACRGSGVVTSNLGGSPHQIPCPWCDGGGVWLPDHDAQAHWRDQSAESPASAAS